MVGVLVVAFICNLLIRPVSEKYAEDMTEHRAEIERDRQASMAAEQGAAASASGLRLVLSWAFVSALLAYGVVMTAITAAKLFTG
ncbi:MFS transporter small subunit [Nocardioides rotundus]|uniref:MFS transporter small subunit n=1 Tax=Nocardioides rotundus TaxID=1774216 RepID=UPI001CBE2543|nr:hypothetical protein [Nocardioides rotundus]